MVSDQGRAACPRSVALLSIHPVQVSSARWVAILLWLPHSHRPSEVLHLHWHRGQRTRHHNNRVFALALHQRGSPLVQAPLLCPSTSTVLHEDQDRHSRRMEVAAAVVESEGHANQACKRELERRSLLVLPMYSQPTAAAAIGVIQTAETSLGSLLAPTTSHTLMVLLVVVSVVKATAKTSATRRSTASVAKCPTAR